MTARDHGRTVYEAHHAAMHEQVGRRGSHHKGYDNLTPPVRARYVAAGQAVAGPLERELAVALAERRELAHLNAWQGREIARLRELLNEAGMADPGEPASAAELTAIIDAGDSVADHPTALAGATQERHPGREVNLLTEDERQL